MIPTESLWASAKKKKMAPERDIGVKNKYPCTLLFFTLSQLRNVAMLKRYTALNITLKRYTTLVTIRSKIVRFA